MTIDEIFGKIASHMIEGLMFHSQMAEYYEFLGLNGYSQCHEYHYLEETRAYHKIAISFIDCFNKLLPNVQAADPGLIPANWYKYSRMDVDMNTKRNAVKAGLEKWVAWERETKALYQKMYQEALNIGEIAAAKRIYHLIEDVTEELKSAEQYLLNKRAMDYDMVNIIEEQTKQKEYYDVQCRSLFLN